MRGASFSLGVPCNTTNGSPFSSTTFEALSPFCAYCAIISLGFGGAPLLRTVENALLRPFFISTSCK